MTHLKIIQNNTLADTEEVSQEIIQKLYDQVVSGDLDAEMKGRLHLTAGYRAQAEYLHQMFPNLIITADTYIIPFEDPKMLAYLNSIGVGSNGVITEADAAAATVVANSQNTEVTKFNELRYFTSITESRGGINGKSEGWVRFMKWTALEEVDISNFTSIGHTSDSGRGDTFNGCSSLKKVIASDKLEVLGYKAFYNCSNLEEITNLNSGTVTVYGDAFSYCTKLKNQCFDNVEVLFPATGGQCSFFQTKLITSLTLSNACTNIPSSCFEESFIETINMPQNVVTINTCAFKNSKINSIDLSRLTTIAREAFYNCKSLAIELNSSSIQSLDEKAFFGSGITKVKLSNLSSLYTNYDWNRKVFSNCTSLTEADFTGSTITTIDGFYGCTNLTSVTIPSTVTRVEMQAFTNTKLTSFDFSNITELGRDCFRNTKLTSVDLSNITKIDNGAFGNCTQLTSITLPSGSFSWVTEGSTNEGDIFAGCTALTTIDLSNCSTFSRSWFRNCSSLTQVILPQNINKIYQEFFYHCSNLSSLGSKITPTYIGDRAFEDCTQIDNNDIDLSAATYIGHSAMKNTAISGVLNLTECLTLGENVFRNCAGITEIHAPKLTDFNAYTNWDGFANLEVLDLPVTTRINNVQNNPKLTTINAPLATNFSTYDSGACCFANCPLLSTLNINFSAVTKFGAWCFNKDTGLNGQYLDFPNVTLIDSEALKLNGINFIFRNSSVITLTGYGWFTNYTGTIYVPDNLVATYKSTSGWSDIANQIKGISELPAQ